MAGFKRSYGKRGGGNASYSNNAASTSSQNDTVIELDKKKQVTVRQFNGVNLVDIREFYLDKDTKEKKPGKKGISLTEESWLKLIENQYNIQNALDKFNGLGGAEPPVKRVKKEQEPAKSRAVVEEGDDDDDDDDLEDVTEAKDDKKDIDFETKAANDEPEEEEDELEEE